MYCKALTAAGIILAAVLPLPAAAAIQQFAGPGRGDGGPSRAAFIQPNGCTVPLAGVVYVADGNGNEIRRVAGGLVERIAGTGQVGAPFDGDGGPATAARLNYPGDVAVGPDGTVYFTETSNQLVKAISPAGTLRTFAGGFFNNPFAYPFGLAIGPDGGLYLADSAQNRIVRFALPCESNCPFTVVAGTGSWGFNGDGGLATAATLRTPRDVTFDAAGNLLIADSDNHRVRKVTPAGIISTVAGSGAGPFAGDGGPATAAKLGQPFSIAVAGGELFVADTNNNRVRKVGADGLIITIAGTGLANPMKDFSTNPLALAIGMPKALCVGAGLFIGTETDQALYRLELEAVPPTATQVAATATATETALRTATATAVATSTASATAVAPTQTARRSATSTRTRTASATATQTVSVGTATSAPSPTGTATRAPPTVTATATQRATLTATPSASAAPTLTATDTATPTSTPTATQTAAPTDTRAIPALSCDITGDGTISIVDVVRINQFILGLRATCP